ncbi:mitochondrial chaperone BCS1-B [Spatholobus suberectus]|nr:mitochondrial chaperone BCS1-B [Spatholobus suberectus]
MYQMWTQAGSLIATTMFIYATFMRLFPSPLQARVRRSLVTESYLKHVFEEAKAIEMNNRQLKLYSNSKTKWSHVVFEHPATFETLAMKPKKKEDIINDLVKFKSGKSNAVVNRVAKPL